MRERKLRATCLVVAIVSQHLQWETCACCRSRRGSSTQDGRRGREGAINPDPEGGFILTLRPDLECRAFLRYLEGGGRCHGRNCAPVLVCQGLVLAWITQLFSSAVAGRLNKAGLKHVWTWRIANFDDMIESL